MAIVEPPELALARPISAELEALDPAVLRRLDGQELTALAEAIRAFLIDTVAATGGHLGSNLGVVELTLALHRVFDSPADPIVWDTGHQAYVHKLVTGRHEWFGRLRQEGGLSGYPSRAESAHDLVENSHASTALSYACGLARARRLRGQPGTVVAVVGDGALTGGMAYEALNNIGAAATPLVIVLNDNGRSYAPTVGRLTLGDPLGPGLGEAPGGPRPPAAAFFGALGLAYRGPVDGHDIAAVEAELRAAARDGGPVVVHVRTAKGRGYLPAEADEEKRLHDLGPFDPATGRARAKGARTYANVLGEVLCAEAAARPEVVAITAAMPGPTGLLGFAARHPERCFDVGIAEQHAVTMAAGMALQGFRPVVALYSTFLNRAWDQVYYDVGLHRLPVVFCIDRAGITGDDGPSHHGVLDLALLTKVPGMTVLAPSSAEDLEAMVRHVLETSVGPVAIRWPKGDAPSGQAGAGLSARCLRRGASACLIGVGRLVGACAAAAELLAAAGVEVSVWDARAVVPLDPHMLADAARHPLVVVAEDAVAEGGAGSKVAAELGEGGPPVLRAGVPIAYVPQGRAADLLARFGLDGPGLAARVLAAD
jgi:1-deoxy-D-xylulose-5-phosphate synthase